MRELPNVPRAICNALIGKHHTPVHRGVAGIFMMAVGVFIAKSAPHHPMAASMLCDGIGYFLHGLGAVPFVDKWTDPEA